MDPEKQLFKLLSENFFDFGISKNIHILNFLKSQRGE